MKLASCARKVIESKLYQSQRAAQNEDFLKYDEKYISRGYMSRELL